VGPDREGGGSDKTHPRIHKENLPSESEMGNDREGRGEKGVDQEDVQRKRRRTPNGALRPMTPEKIKY